MYLYLLLIPLLSTLIAWYFFRHKFARYELFVPLLTCSLFILISYLIQKNSNNSSIEYNGYYVVEARYYEYWETYVDETCTGTTSSTDSNGNTTTTTYTYDCSYCDRNYAYYVMVLNNGHTVSISEEYYNYLKRIWNNEKYINLNRSINYSGSCGEDGNMYKTYWNNDINTSITVTYKHKYTNYIKYNRSAFNYGNNEYIYAKNLYNYPQIESYKYQNTILGLENLDDKSINTKALSKHLNFFNGYYGQSNKIRYYTFFYKGLPLDVAFEQERYLLGGNQNELSICIGLDDEGLNIEWVYVFGWSENKITHYYLRDELLEMKKVDYKNMYDIYVKSKDTFKYKDFEDFNYIEFKPNTKEMGFVLWGVVILTIITLGFCLLNNDDSEDY